MSDDTESSRMMTRMMMLSAPVMRELEPKDRVDFLRLLKAIAAPYCPKCGEAYADGCVCTM